MTSADERLLDLEKRMATVEQYIIDDKDIKEDIRNSLKEIKDRNSKADEFIDAELEARKDSAEFWKNQKDKLATAGIIGAMGLIGSAIWYALIQFIQESSK